MGGWRSGQHPYFCEKTFLLPEVNKTWLLIHSLHVFGPGPWLWPATIPIPGPISLATGHPRSAWLRLNPKEGDPDEVTTIQAGSNEE